MRYEIGVEGILAACWSAWSDGLGVSGDASGTTSITGPARDQAALHGLLAKALDLGLPLLAVRPLRVRHGHRKGSRNEKDRRRAAGVR